MSKVKVGIIGTGNIQDVDELERAALSIRKDLLRLCASEAIHIGGDLSSADIMTVLWQYQIKYHPDDPKAENRDRFVLSKGHSSAVMSFEQSAIGCFPKEDIFREYARDGGRFSMHSCSLANPFAEVSTGSLGHGLPVACGIAAALRLKGNRQSRVYVLMGDGEQSEGSVWEAAANAAHFGLGNLVALIDSNGLMADGAVSEITSYGNIGDKYRSFGWDVHEIDGHDIREIKRCLDGLPVPCSGIPSVLVCRTTKGKGVPFMENEAKWHAGKITQEQYLEGMEALDSVFRMRGGGGDA